MWDEGVSKCKGSQNPPRGWGCRKSKRVPPYEGELRTASELLWRGFGLRGAGRAA